MSYQIYIGVKEESMVLPVIKEIKHLNCKVMLGNNVNSFSQLVNKCIQDCFSNYNVIIFCSHRVRPTESDINRLLSKINEGYGYVGLYRFAFFGIHRDVIKQVGLFDENFIAGYEDDDFRIRLNYHNIAFYEDHSTVYLPGLTSWTNNRSVEEKYFHTKYTIDSINKTIKINFDIFSDISSDISSDDNNKKDKKFLTHKDSVYVKDVGSYYGWCGPGIHNFTFITS